MFYLYFLGESREFDEDSKRKKLSKDKKRSKKKDKRKKKKRGGSSSSSSSDSETSDRDKRKSKTQSLGGGNTGQNLVAGLLPDLGDLEAKLSAYYSKIEHDKLDIPQQGKQIGRKMDQDLLYGGLDAPPVKKTEIMSQQE